ncbi:hypothetical protein COD21_14310 [Bacillus cereus]|uniref:carbohydrate binding domain-containing protein n=1 Tax=Bacillus cereus TaxID=1396 RepID=UPI000BFBBCC1|nr:carbohydrate binding domain-containing protein [Bacillus cereus]PGU10499.1 hypothetical protein COD21_14310 [Bacillus cereus]
MNGDFENDLKGWGWINLDMYKPMIQIEANGNTYITGGNGSSTLMNATQKIRVKPNATYEVSFSYQKDEFNDDNTYVSVDDTTTLATQFLNDVPSTNGKWKTEKLQFITDGYPNEVRFRISDQSDGNFKFDNVSLRKIDDGEFIIGTLETVFPDKELANAIASILNKKTTDPVTKGDLEGVTSLEIRSESQNMDLRGLEYLTNLEDLNLISNGISDISPLAELDHPIYISLSGNQITDLRPLSSLPEDIKKRIDAESQWISLENGKIGIPTPFKLFDVDSSVPKLVWMSGKGQYKNEEITWETFGINDFVWESVGDIRFSGYVRQSIK